MINEQGRSAEIFKAWSGQIIEWKIKAPGVRSIRRMPPKKLEKNKVFRKEPRKVFLSRSWKAKIEIENRKAVEYYYNIVWIDINGVSRTFDPVIQVKPKK